MLTQENLCHKTYTFLKEKLGLGPEYTGKPIELSQDLGSESLEPQVVDESSAFDEIPAIDGSQLKTTDSTQEAVKSHLNVGAQAAGVMNDKSSHVTITEKKASMCRENVIFFSIKYLWYNAFQTGTVWNVLLRSTPILLGTVYTISGMIAKLRNAFQRV